VSPEVNGPAPAGAGPNRGGIRMGAGAIVGNAVALSRFAGSLSQRLDRPVVDQTKFAGLFDLQLQWAPGAGENPYGQSGDKFPESVLSMDGKAVGADVTGPSLFSAIQEQLGLKLEAAKGPVEVLVIDHVERPSEN
jgi:uncharacterized protein (TIGR03435 family)